MPAWSKPQDFRTWMVQGMSLRGTVLFLIVLAILISEFRFSWVEMLVGRYLAVTNAHRPESGSVWDQGRLKQVATQTLEQMVTRQLTARREASEAASLAQLVHGLGSAHGTMISTDKFKDLYINLPESVSRKLFSPILMLRLTADRSWDRVYLERENDQVGIYLLDRNNNVLSYTTVSDQQLRAEEDEQPVLSGRLEEREEFVGRIYPADRFFMAVDTLPLKSQRGIFLHPSALLVAEGTPVRVGISDEVHSDLIRIGVEMDAPQGQQIHIIVGKEWSVRQVRALLEPRLSRSANSRFHWPHLEGGP